MDTLRLLAEITGYIAGGLAGVGIVGAIALQLFKHWGVKWLDSKFDERLQNLRHAQSQEIEGLRFKISQLLDRATKLHEREFEALPEAWAKINKSYWEANALIAPLQQLVDLSRMDDAHREEYISRSRLSDRQKDDVRKANDPTSEYEKLIFWHRLADAKNASVDSSRYLGMHGIFIEPELRKKMDRLNGLIWAALIEVETNKEMDLRGRERLRDQAEGLRQEGSTLKEALETAIHQRIWPTAEVTN